ncbi:MAG: ABC transporter substrate-binding protein [Clostridia bacterium]|nr:ABC transporter substrate-binding protein [Clostridia bacterium]
MTDFFKILRGPLAVLLAAALLCSFCGCSFLYGGDDISEILGASDPQDDSTDETDRQPRAFSLAYYTQEALDPYTSASRTNTELLRLCYSGLFSVDKEYNAIPVLADSYEVDGNTVTVTLRSDVVFSDGTALTAEDCKDSYDRAAKKDSIWKDAFSYIRSYKAVDRTTFQITFRSYAPTQLNLLTIPIVKKGSTDPAGYPVGCGRYRFDNVGALSLVKTDCNSFPGSYGVERILLTGIADREALIYHFNYGKIQAVCADLSLGAEEYRSDNEIVTVPTSRFTFLGVNRSKPELADVNFSKGLTYLIDRSKVVSEALNGFATPVWTPLNPAWSVTKQAELNPDITSLVSAGNAFTQAGFVLDGSVRKYHGKDVTLRILVNRENAARVKTAQLIAASLTEAGFTVEVVQHTWDRYQTALKTLDFDLYVGEINLSDNLDLSALFSGDICPAGEPEGTYETLRIEALAVLNGTGDVRTFVSKFQSALPLVPLYYSVDALAVSMDVAGDFGGSVSEFYAGIENWVFTDKKA